MDLSPGDSTQVLLCESIAHETEPCIWHIGYLQRKMYKIESHHPLIEQTFHTNLDPILRADYPTLLPPQKLAGL